MMDGYTTKEAAVVLGISETTVRWLMRHDKLNYTLVNPRFALVDKASVAVYQQTRRRPGWAKGRSRKEQQDVL